LGATSGVEIEVDDFGTGHASIVSLTRLKPDRLKIDHALVENIEKSKVQAKLISSIIEICHVLGISITAEGVENERQTEMLRTVGCDEPQGFALAKPMTSLDLIDFLTQRTIHPVAPFAQSVIVAPRPSFRWITGAQLQKSGGRFIVGMQRCGCEA
jgi:diguanylate cyclase